jgi:hypothetical protein
MRNDQDIEDIISELRDLQIQQTLISRLERLSESGNNVTEPAPPTGRMSRRFANGDRARIRNPGILQANKGMIVRIGEDTILFDKLEHGLLPKEDLPPNNMIHCKKLYCQTTLHLYDGVVQKGVRHELPTCLEALGWGHPNFSHRQPLWDSDPTILKI